MTYTATAIVCAALAMCTYCAESDAVSIGAGILAGILIITAYQYKHPRQEYLP